MESASKAGLSDAHIWFWTIFGFRKKSESPRADSIWNPSEQAGAIL
jgi:hypothetical protein